MLSVFALFWIALLATLMLFSSAALWRRFGDIDEQSFLDRYESLFLGLQTSEKPSLSQPSIYMGRRFIYALVIVLL